jgi:hypothetical protein
LSNKKFVEKKVCQAKSLSNKKFVKQNVCRTKSFVKQKFVEQKSVFLKCATCVVEDVHPGAGEPQAEQEEREDL